MKAAWYEKTGDASDVLKVGELPDPSPGSNEVLISVKTSGIIHLTSKLEQVPGAIYNFQE